MAGLQHIRGRPLSAGPQLADMLLDCVYCVSSHGDGFRTASPVPERSAKYSCLETFLTRCSVNSKGPWAALHDPSSPHLWQFEGPPTPNTLESRSCSRSLSRCHAETFGLASSAGSGLSGHRLAGSLCAQPASEIERLSRRIHDRLRSRLLCSWRRCRCGLWRLSRSLPSSGGEKVVCDTSGFECTALLEFAAALVSVLPSCQVGPGASLRQAPLLARPCIEPSV